MGMTVKDQFKKVESGIAWLRHLDPTVPLCSIVLFHNPGPFSFWPWVPAPAHRSSFSCMHGVCVCVRTYFVGVCLRSCPVCVWLETRHTRCFALLHGRHF